VDLHTTIIVLAVGVAISGVALWLEHHPKDVHRMRLIPTTPILVVGVLIALAAIVHLLTFMAGH
jgi:hypothetical protein